MSIIYLHSRNVGQNKFGQYCIDALGGKTVAMESIKPWLVADLKVGDFFDVRVGIAKCSDEDRYNKKIGRDMAKSRMKPSKLTVKSTHHIEDRSNFTLVDDKGNSFMFVKYASASEVFLVDIF